MGHGGGKEGKVKKLPEGSEILGRLQWIGRNLLARRNILELHLS